VRRCGQRARARDRSGRRTRARDDDVGGKNLDASSARVTTNAPVSLGHARTSASCSFALDGGNVFDGRARRRRIVEHSIFRLPRAPVPAARSTTRPPRRGRPHPPRHLPCLVQSCAAESCVTDRRAVDRQRLPGSDQDCDRWPRTRRGRDILWCLAEFDSATADQTQRTQRTTKEKRTACLGVLVPFVLIQRPRHRIETL